MYRRVRLRSHARRFRYHRLSRPERHPARRNGVEKAKQREKRLLIFERERSRRRLWIHRLAGRPAWYGFTLALRTGGCTADARFSAAGEAVIVTRNSFNRRRLAPGSAFAPDIFEYVYFARPDSVLDGVSVYRSRMAMGELLAEEVRTIMDEENIQVDVVIPVRGLVRRSFYQD